MSKSPKPIIYFLGPTKSGKTTTMEKIITKLSDKKISCGTIKFIHHPTLTLDPAGKDSSRHRQAGSLFTLNFAPKETALIIKKEERENIDDAKRILDQPNNILPFVEVVLCESLNNPPPKSMVFISANSKSEVDQYLKPLEECKIIAIVGNITNNKEKNSQYKSIPLLSALEEQELEEIIEKIIKQIK